MIGIVILAAGSSSRLGKPKQNLLFNNKTLLQHAIVEAKLLAENVLVVLGSTPQEIIPTIEKFDITVLHNEHWQEGMATSITIAVEYLLNLTTAVDAVIFMVCDQPYANACLLQQLIELAETSEKGIVACTYKGAIGVPVYFKKKYFLELLNLKGKEGAKKLIEKFRNDVKTMPFSRGHIDIDTPEDFVKLHSANNHLH